jgi:hypothetical protein
MGESSARFFRVRVPAVYLTSAYSLFLAFFTFNRINNLRAFNVAFSSIPTAPTKTSLILLPFHTCTSQNKSIDA